MLIGSKAQLKSLNVDDFILSYDDMPFELVENAKYLGMFINCDISWDFHVRRLCQTTYYHISLLRSYVVYFQRIVFYKCIKVAFNLVWIMVSLCMAVARKKNIDLVQRVQNHAARLITGNFDYINSRGIDLVKSLNWYTIRERRYYFLLTLMFEAIYGIATYYLSDRLICTLISMVIIPEKLVQWTFIFQLCTKRCTKIVFYIWAANFGMICQILWRPLRI